MSSCICIVCIVSPSDRWAVMSGMEFPRFDLQVRSLLVLVKTKPMFPFSPCQVRQGIPWTKSIDCQQCREDTQVKDSGGCQHVETCILRDLGRSGLAWGCSVKQR